MITLPTPEDATDAAELADPALDRYARILGRVLDVPTAAVTFVEATRQVDAGAVGLPEEQQRTRIVPLSHSFCRFIVGGGEPVVVDDTRLHPPFDGHPGITDDNVLAYAGWPITDHTGTILGSLCAIDHRPRRWSAAQVALLRDLADACSSELALRGRLAQARAEHLDVRARADRDRSLLQFADQLAIAETLAQTAETLDDVGRRRLGCQSVATWLLDPSGERLERAGSADVAPVPVGGGGLIATVLSTGSPHFASGPDDAEPDEGGARAYLPLVVGQQVVGVLTLIWPDRRDVSDDDRATVTPLARYAARSIERVRFIAG